MTKVIKYFCDQSDKIFLWPKWWNIIATKMMKYFWNQNDEIYTYFWNQNDEIFLNQNVEILLGPNYGIFLGPKWCNFLEVFWGAGYKHVTTLKSGLCLLRHYQLGQLFP